MIPHTVKTPRKGDNEPAAIEGVGPITTGGNPIRTKEQFGIGTKTEGVAVLPLRVNRIASGERLEHRRRLQPACVEVGKKIREFPVELRRFKAIFLQVLQGNIG